MNLPYLHVYSRNQFVKMVDQLVETSIITCEEAAEKCFVKRLLFLSV